MKQILITLILLCGIYSAKAQKSDSLQVQLSRKWMNSKVYALKLAALMPEENYDFRASPEEMTFREQTLHIADNMNWLSATYLFANAGTKRYSKDTLSKAQVLKVLEDAYERGLQGHKIINSMLNEPIKFFAGPMTRRQILILMHDHQTHHLGQLIVYLRLKGIKPPDYVGW